MKSQQNAVLLLEQFFFDPPEILTKKGGKNKSNFWMVNLYNDETNDFLELWRYIWTSEFD